MSQLHETTLEPRLAQRLLEGPDGEWRLVTISPNPPDFLHAMQAATRKSPIETAVALALRLSAFRHEVRKLMDKPEQLEELETIVKHVRSKGGRILVLWHEEYRLGIPIGLQAMDRADIQQELDKGLQKLEC